MDDSFVIKPNISMDSRKRNVPDESKVYYYFFKIRLS